MMDLDFDDIDYLKPLIELVCDVTDDDNYADKLKESFFQYFLTNIDNELSSHNILDNVYEPDSGWGKISDFIHNKSSEYGFTLHHHEISQISENVDMDSFIESNISSSERDELNYDAWKESRYNEIPRTIDEIDDIFYREE